MFAERVGQEVQLSKKCNKVSEFQYERFQKWDVSLHFDLFFLRQQGMSFLQVNTVLNNVITRTLLPSCVNRKYTLKATACQSPLKILHYKRYLSLQVMYEISKSVRIMVFSLHMYMTWSQDIGVPLTDLCYLVTGYQYSPY